MTDIRRPENTTKSAAVTPARSSSPFAAHVKRRLRIDRAARWCVSLGGMVIIGSIVAIVIVIVIEILPLCGSARATPRPIVPSVTERAAFALVPDERRTAAAVIGPGGLAWTPLSPGGPLPDGAERASAALHDALRGARIAACAPFGVDGFALGLSDGRVLPVSLRLQSTYDAEARGTSAALTIGAAEQALAGPAPVTLLAHRGSADGSLTAFPSATHEIVLLAVDVEQSLDGPPKRVETRSLAALPAGEEARALALDDRGEQIFVGTRAGRILRIEGRSSGAPVVAESVPAVPDGEEIACLSFLIGNRTLVVGGSQGSLSTWMMVNDSEGGTHLRRVHDFAPSAASVTSISPCRRNHGFLTADAAGTVRLHYGTTGRTFLSLSTDFDAVRCVAYAPKADGIVAVDAAGRVCDWDLDNPHPEAGLDSLFGKVWYEGYAGPEYVWQSSSGTDDFEPKLSLVPLLYGTLKGTLYALVFAVPIALLSALYASQFLRPSIRNRVKPVIEIMAALPSVVLGFLAALWLAPAMERVVPGVFLSLLVVPASIVLALVGWRRLPARTHRRLSAGEELAILAPVVLFSVWLSLALGARVEAWLPGGDYRAWLRNALGLGYDQRNSLVVAFAMGFAVIPVIFTIAEDSLSNVPPHLSAGSLALGATPWQTVVRVVLPAASPGIFSAAMVGFGRAVGETMIVLMATGNTPIMDASIFNGFRALSANIAVELPEAPEGGTHFRVLFLAALLLFILTFCVNTVAEVVRLRLRQRYTLL